MFNRKYELVNPRNIVESVQEISLKEGHVLVRPSLLSICAADLRYYTGERDEKILKEKLPLTLIHESIGHVILDPSNEFPKGTAVVLIPNKPTNLSGNYKENYDRTSKFASSSSDGFMQDFLSIEKSRVIEISGIDSNAAVMLELMSVVFNAIDDLPERIFKDNTNIGIWGNGNIGYLATIIIKNLYPSVNVYVFGRDEKKNQYFAIANGRFLINEIPEELIIDHAFECVGGRGSEVAINQIIDLIQPQGIISLLGVSERAPHLNTRMILEKGLTLVGSSRSGYKDFEEAVLFLKASKDRQSQVKRLVTTKEDVKTTDDMINAFEKSISTEFKTVMKWNV